MNIFKALSEGNGKISETNVTSFMNYLLDSTNELNNSFFVLFAKLIDQHQDNNKLCDLIGISQKTIREQILSFSNNFSVSSEPEYCIKNQDGSKQIPDILLRIISKSTKKEIAYLIIENKISKSAIKKGQIEKQFDYFSKSEDYEKGIPIYSILITPDEKAFGELYSQAVEKNKKTVWLKWVNHAELNFSIEAILRELIKHEQNVEIEPIDPNTQFILKSFIDYIATEFSFKENGKRSYSFKGFKEIELAYAKIDNMEYYIRRFSNGMIRIFDKEDKLLEIEVKPILRKINEVYELGIELPSTGKARNTRTLGREIINGLNNN